MSCFVPQLIIITFRSSIHIFNPQSFNYFYILAADMINDCLYFVYFVNCEAARLQGCKATRLYNIKKLYQQIKKEEMLAGCADEERESLTTLIR